ncbi:hypothetical protein HNP38_003020 [Chryseobacterium defluvii]|uniref:Uncharacterized protein n=1 Tax=Chryseobacterium defluvii TaxID=160396 RepID=A0A840KJ49_9FLAO|nr:hypothetical protein [Chryseobacterium defluvii]MBB4807704.1 hypothetical protein [Chryseobacterium defluvii]
MFSTTAFSQVGINTSSPSATFDVVGKPDDTSKMDGIIPPRITGEQLRAKTYTAVQTGALVYVTAADPFPAGQTINVTMPGYYYFNGTQWVSTGGNDSDTNIYNANGTLAGNRTVTFNGNRLDFVSSNQMTQISSSAGLRQVGLASSSTKNASINVSAPDNNSNGIPSNGYLQIYPESQLQLIATNDATGLNLSTSQTTNSAPISFFTNPGNALGVFRMIITGGGNVGIGMSSPSEIFHVSGGNVRLQKLPLNGETNAIFTMPNGATSPIQNQTFNATRTVVADANGVLGYINGTPSEPGVPKVVISVGVPGNQNIRNAISPAVTAQFTNEYIDTYNAWGSNTFTVPSEMGGLYVMAMQNSNQHTVGGGDWHTIAFYERSTDGGTTWQTLTKDTSALVGTNVDNGNSLYWTGNLNAGDRVRIRFNCSSTTDNIVMLGSLTITKLAQ